jgi:purine-binding chemotaxis protein CheW
MNTKIRGNYMSVSSITETSQYLTFKLENEVFALDIAKVREVLDFTRITKVPQTPDFMLGIINLRGAVVPVIDMRLKFGLPQAATTVNSCFIIAEIELDTEATVLGALVDSVQEVMELDPDQIEPPPRIGTRLNTKFIKGMGKRDDQFVIILDIDKVFSTDELALAREMGTDEKISESVAQAN